MSTLTPIREEVGDVLRVVGWRLEGGTVVKRPNGAMVMYQPQPWEPEPIVLQSPSDPEVTITLRNLGRRVPDPIQLPDDDPRVNPAWAAIREAVEADPSLSAEEPKPPPTAEEIEAARVKALAEAKAAGAKKISDWTLAGFARGFAFDGRTFSLSANAQLNWNSVANELNAEAIANGGKVPSDWRQGVTMQPVGEYVLTAETGPEFVKAAIAAGKAILDPQRKASAALAIATTTDEVAAALALLGG